MTAEPRLDLPEAVRLTNIVMSACNLSGVAHDFPRIMEAAWDDVHKHGGGTDQTNHHPLAVLWLVKMAELTGLCVEAHDARTTIGDGSYSGGAIHHAFAWLRDQKA